MKIELINTGTELMLGSILNTDQQWLCRELSQRGYVVARQVAVADDSGSIRAAVQEALGRPDVDLVITTGGLGPTSDDLTRQAIAGLLGRSLREDPETVAKIEGFFRARKRPMPAQVRVQALVPEGAIVLPNGNGTAPGLVLETGSEAAGSGGRPKLLIMLPGPPRELQPMFVNQVAPILRERFPVQGCFACRVLRSTGMGESMVEETVAGPLAPMVKAGLEVGYCARFGEVDVRLVARGSRAEDLVGQAERTVGSLLGKYVFASNGEQLEEVLVRKLTALGQTVAVAESCTGGYIASRITDVPGASVVFLGGFVTYSNEAKQALLGVKLATLNAHGAVSEAAAREMAEGALARMKSTYALAVTGIAGPGGGTPEKPVGTVYLALAGPEPTVVLHQVNRYDRASFKFVTSQQALDLLRRKLPE